MLIVDDKQMIIVNRSFIFNQLLYDKLGFNPPEGMDGITEVVLSVEELMDINPDYLFVRNENEEFYDEIFSNPAVQQINAVKNNRVYAMHWSLFRNIYGVSLAVDLIMELITGEDKGKGMSNYHTFAGIEASNMQGTS